nr:hypothetical protein [Cupriavidus gilardii]WDE72690.1 hypothetical protein [Cupriavidus gilardii]
MKKFVSINDWRSSRRVEVSHADTYVHWILAAGVAAFIGVALAWYF